MYKKLSLIIISLMIAGLLTACNLAVAPGNEGLRTLNVSGTGRVTVVPDIATINIGVRTESEVVIDALDENTAQANAIAKALQDLGIAPEDIQTANFNVFPNERYDYMTGQVEGRYFVVENTINVTVRDLPTLGMVLSTVVEAGANSIYGINFNIADREAAVTEARQLAIEDAQAKAQSIAEAAGVKLGELVNINVYESWGPMPYYDAGYGAYAEGVPVAAGTLTIALECNLTYSIE